MIRGRDKHGRSSGNIHGLCCTELRGITVRAQGQTILDDITLHIHCGEITAIVGPNGGGKTTLMRALLGLTRYEGEVRFLDAGGGPARMPRIGYVPQRLEYDRDAPVTVKDMFFAALSGQPAFIGVSSRVDQIALESLKAVDAERLLGTRLGTLSGGELQRVMLALALTPAPDALLLDEPSSGVDEGGLDAFYDAVDRARRENDLTVILISHDMARLSTIADRMALIDKRLIAIGTPDEVTQSAAFAEVFGRI